MLRLILMPPNSITKFITRVSLFIYVDRDEPDPLISSNKKEDYTREVRYMGKYPNLFKDERISKKISKMEISL